jgi:hypothetical protein
MKRHNRKVMTPARVLPVLTLIPLLALCLAGCQRPTSVQYAPTDVTGEWNVSASNVSGDGMTCGVTGLIVTLTQNGDGTFSGNAVGGQLICNYMGTETAQNVTGLTVTGSVDVAARTIGIDVPVDSATLTGTVDHTNDFMSGTTQLVIGVGGGGNVTVTGPWSASKVGSQQ